MEHDAENVGAMMWTSIYEGTYWKFCSKCKIEKPPADFCQLSPRPGIRTDRLTSWCRLCYSAYFKKPDVQRRRLDKEKEYLKKPRVRKQRRATYRKYDQAPTSRYSNLAASAAKRKLTMTISFDEWAALVIPNACHYCGGGLGHSGISLDRKYNENGYTLDNVVPCCGECNYMKRDMPYHEFALLAPVLQEIKRGRIEKAMVSA